MAFFFLLEKFTKTIIRNNQRKFDASWGKIKIALQPYYTWLNGELTVQSEDKIVKDLQLMATCSHKTLTI